MSNENGTETPRSDSLGAAESLFGDTPADQTVAVAKEEDSKNETEQVYSSSRSVTLDLL